MKEFAYIYLCSLVFLLINCSPDDKIEDVYPVDPTQKTEWLERMNGDIESLKSIVSAIQEGDSVTKISIQDNVFKLEFINNPEATIILDNVSYSAPLIGAHKIDNNYYWTQIIGTGTSATTLIKNEDRSNNKITSQGDYPQLDISEYGNWLLSMRGNKKEIFDPEGKPFRATGPKALFQSISFDTDSNATVITNESPNRNYVVPKYRPFTFRILNSITDTLNVAAGFSIPLDFLSSGIVSFEYDLPKAWSVTHTFSEDKKSGVLIVTTPTGLEEEYDETGKITIKAVNAYGDKLPISIPVKSAVGLVNFASINFSDIPSDINIESSNFIFSTESLTDERSVTTIKVQDEFRVMLPDGYPILKKAIFTVEGGDSFTYYFPPKQILSIGDQTISLAPPKIKSYWQGGIIIEIDGTYPKTGVDAYNITGTVMAPEIAPSLPWYPNSSVNVTDAMSTTDGASNTTAIIKALGGPGTSAGFIARWAIRVTSGGYTDWYLPVANEYMLIHQIFNTDKESFNDLMEAYGGQRFIYGQASGNHRNFWTSENINASQAKMAILEGGAAGTVSPGTKVYGCYGLACRKIK